MKAVIVGCGRVGAIMAAELDAAGHDVLIIDRSQSAFDRLPSSFRGSAVRGDGTDEDVLRQKGAEDADLFLALTEGDNRNIMAAQLAAEALGAKRTVAKVNDPVRSEAYGHLGVATICRTNLMADALLGALGFSVPARPGVLDVRPHDHDGAGGAPSSTPVPAAVAVPVSPSGELTAPAAPPQATTPGTAAGTLDQSTPASAAPGGSDRPTTPEA